MATMITCPSCKISFALEEVMVDDLKKEYRAEMVAYKGRKDEELKQMQEALARKESEIARQVSQQEEIFNRKLAEEKKILRQSLEENLRKSITGDFENQLKFLKQANQDNEERLRVSRQKELVFLQKEQELKIRESELDIALQKKLQDERTKLAEELRKLEEQRMAARETEYQLRLKEMEKQLEDQKKLAEEMKRRAEQGSMQLQGEVQELALEDLLRANFPFDEIREVGKGKRGADCIQTVRNTLGQECGKIIYESKRAEHFGGDWIEKLKADMRSQGAHFAILVTKTMPRDMDHFGEREGVWICSFAEVKPLAFVLRDGIIRIFHASKAQENKGDKMQLLYDYLTSNEFGEQWKAIREGFLAMKNSIQRERDAMEKLWKAREKQLEKVLLHAVHIQGSVEGIAGDNSVDLNLLGDANDELAIE